MSNELDRRETEITLSKRQRRPPGVALIAALAIAGSVALASVAQAVRQESWGPIWSIGWLPAVLVASLWAPGSRKPCGPRLRKLTGR